MSADAHELYDLALNVGASAAAWVREQRPAGRVGVADHKSSSTDPVTELDRGCEQMIRRQILHERPDDGFIGEEGDDIPSGSGVRWVVDPIDGTVNFIYGISSWSVSIAAQYETGEHQNETVAAVVIDGVRNVAWGAVLGNGAWKIDGDNRETIESAGVSDLEYALVGTGFNYLPSIREHQAKAAVAMIPHIRDIRRLGSAALDLCAVAEGTLDAFVEQGLKEWDLAAGELISRESGAKIVGLNGPPDERLVISATPAIARDFFELVNVCGF